MRCICKNNTNAKFILDLFIINKNPKYTLTFIKSNLPYVFDFIFFLQTFAKITIKLPLVLRKHNFLNHKLSLQWKQQLPFLWQVCRDLSRKPFFRNRSNLCSRRDSFPPDQKFLLCTGRTRSPRHSVCTCTRMFPDKENKINKLLKDY